MAERTPEAEQDFKDWMAGQSGYIGKSKKAAWWDDWDKSQQSQGMMNNYLTNPQGGFNLYGTGEQKIQQAANLSQVGAMTGQNIFDAGEQQQDYYQSMQKRRNGEDAVAENMRAGRNRNLANVGRNFAGRGVAGGVAAAGMNTATNTADSEINAQTQKNARQNDMDLWNYVKRNQKVTGEALAMGSDQGLAAGMDTSQAEGVFGTVICTELYRQGIMDHETYLKDITFGMQLEKTDPHAIKGYRMLAAPFVKLMKKSKFATRCISIPALAWAEQMAGRENFAGKAIMLTGIPLCRFAYRLSVGYYFCPEVREYV